MEEKEETPIDLTHLTPAQLTKLSMRLEDELYLSENGGFMTEESMDFIERVQAKREKDGDNEANINRLADELYEEASNIAIEEKKFSPKQAKDLLANPNIREFLDPETKRTTYEQTFGEHADVMKDVVESIASEIIKEDIEASHEPPAPSLEELRGGENVPTYKIDPSNGDVTPLEQESKEHNANPQPEIDEIKGLNLSMLKLTEDNREPFNDLNSPNLDSSNKSAERHLS